MNTKHTPSPWIITETIEFGQFPFIHIDNEETEFHVCTIQNGGPEDKANALLIKVAPELLARLRKLCKAAYESVDGSAETYKALHDLRIKNQRYIDKLDV